MWCSGSIVCSWFRTLSEGTWVCGVTLKCFDRCKCSDSVTVILKCPLEIFFCDVFQVSDFSGVLMMSFVR